MTLCNDPASGSTFNLNDGISYLMTQGMGLGNEGIHGLVSVFGCEGVSIFRVPLVGSWWSPFSFTFSSIREPEIAGGVDSCVHTS